MINSELKKIIDKEGFIITSIKGISMLPLLDETKDLVKIVKVNRELAINDMVMYQVNNKIVLHRIIDIKDNYYEIVGDNLTTIEKIDKSLVFGVVDSYFKNGREVKLTDQEYLDYLNNLERDLSKRKKIYKIKELKRSYKEFISLTQDVINNTNKTSKDINYKEIYTLAKKQKLTAFIFNKIDKNYCPKDIYEKFNNEYNNALRRKILFDNERKEVLKLLDDNSIKYLPVKGNDLNKLYPKGTIREFADNDILIDDQNKVKELMLKRGYKHTYGYVHSSYKKDIYNFEMHNFLFYEDLDKNNFFNDSFKIAIKDEDNNYGYHFDLETNYVYILNHMYKHFNGGGAGLRYYIDLYYYLNTYNMDTSKLNKYLKELDLLTFNKEVKTFIDELVNNDIDLIDKDKVNYMLEGSVYGLLDHKVERDLSERSPLEYTLYRIFISSETMTHLYPSMKNRKVLYPIYFTKRVIDIFTTKSRRKALKKTSSIVFKKK